MDSPPAPHLRRAVRAALPLLAAQGVVFLAGYALGAALLELLAPEELAHFGPLREGLRWATALGVLGLATGLLRLAPERPHDRGDLLFTTAVSVLALSVLVASVFTFVPTVRRFVIRDPVAADLFTTYVWKAPCIALLVTAVAMLHARGRLGAKGVVESVERVLVLVAAVSGALAGGLEGLVLGSLFGSFLAALVALQRVVARRTKRLPRFRPDLLRATFRIGRARVGVQLLEALRPLLLLTVMAEVATATETGMLYGAMMFSLPLIAAPERIAQAVYPGMLDESGETAGVGARADRLFRELLFVAVPALGLFGVVMAFVLPVFKDGAYADAVTSLWLLLPGVAAHGVVAHYGYVVLVRHRLAREAVVSAVALVVTGGLAWGLVPEFGAAGGAAALSIALIVRAVLLAAVARRSPADSSAPS